MTRSAALLLMAITLAPPFGEAAAEARPLPGGAFEVTLAVEVHGDPDFVVAHILDAGGLQETVTLAPRGGGAFAGLVELDTVRLRVAFEAIYPGGSSELSDVVWLAELGVAVEEPPDRPAPPGVPRGLWGALAAVTLLLSASLAWWALRSGRRPSGPPSLFIPGPVDVEPDVLAAQTEPMIGHRSDEFEALFREVEEGLRWALQSSHPVVVTASSGSGWHEGAVRNLVDRRLLCVVQGAFGDRWHRVAVACGKEAPRLDLEWGQAATPDRVLAALEEHGPVEAVTVVHNETSTGVASPVGELAEALRAEHPNVLLLVDAVSSAGGMPTPVDEWRPDLLLTSSQKALALPPGLAFATVSARAAEKAEAVGGRGWYFDILLLLRYRDRSTTPATPAIGLMRAAARRLAKMRREGLEARHQRHRRMGEATRRWALERGFGLFAEDGYASDTLTCVENTRQIDVAGLNGFLRERGMLISNGYGDLKGRTFRIAHMGERTEAELARLLAAIDRYLAS